MKKTVFMLALLPLMFSCSTIGKFPYVQEASIMDYSQYEKKGLFITEANSVSFEYKAVGSVSAKVESGFEVIGGKKVKAIGDDIYQKQMTTKTKVSYGEFVAAPSQALELLYQKSVENRANGIINLKISPITQYTQDYGNVITGYFATGMAIRK